MDVTGEPQEKRRRSAAILIGVLTGLALALRFWRLGDWSLDSDEVFTLRDSVHIRPSNPRPLGYLLNHYLVSPFLPLDEFGLRLLPALFGALAIPAFYLMSRRLVGSRAAFFGALLLTLNALHVIYSQFARYWALVFLLCSVYPYALYIGVRDRNRRMLALGIVTCILASLAHPASILLLGGPALWLLVRFLRPSHLRSLWEQKNVRRAALAGIVVLVLLAVRFIPILHGWITEHDNNPGSGQFLLAPLLAPGLKQLKYLLTYVEGWSFPVVLAGILGVALIWQRRDPLLGRFLTSVAVFPAIFLPLLSLRTPISTYYLMPIAPVFFIGAGVLLDRIAEVDWKLRPRWLVPATLVIVMLAPAMPTLISQYMNGRKYDFKGVAEWLEPRLSTADVVFSDQPVALAHYLPGTDVRRLRYDTLPLSESLQVVQQSNGDALWIVAPAPAHAFRTNLKQGGLAAWMYEHCQLRNSIGEGRVDFRQQYLQVYSCPPGAARSTAPTKQAASLGR